MDTATDALTADELQRRVERRRDDVGRDLEVIGERDLARSMEPAVAQAAATAADEARTAAEHLAPAARDEAAALKDEAADAARSVTDRP